MLYGDQHSIIVGDFLMPETQQPIIHVQFKYIVIILIIHSSPKDLVEL